MLTDEQYNVLLQYEQTFKNAVNSNFIRVAAADFGIIASIYDQIFNPLRPSQRNCNTCRLNAIKTIGKVFLEEKMQRDEMARLEGENAAHAEEKKPVETPKAINTNTPKATKTNKGTTAAKKTTSKTNKGGRPKKIKLED